MYIRKLVVHLCTDMATKPKYVIVATDKNGTATHHGNWKKACSFHKIEPNALYTSLKRKRQANQPTNTYKSRSGITLTKTVLI